MRFDITEKFGKERNGENCFSNPLLGGDELIPLFVPDDLIRFKPVVEKVTKTTTTVVIWKLQGNPKVFYACILWMLLNHVTCLFVLCGFGSCVRKLYEKDFRAR